MNYRHIFHAGNFADVFKHWILTLLLEKFIEKPAPFFVLDTHAGLGEYDLTHFSAQKTLEQDSGVQRILSKELEPAFQAYYDILYSNNAGEIYPGSPRFIQAFLRADDQLFATELHEQDFLTLRDNFAGDKNVKVLHQSGYAAIKALLPPRQKRGLVFIDPPFEKTDEFAQIVAALKIGLQRFAHGTYAIWYPIKDQDKLDTFYADLTKLPITKSLCVELHANEIMPTQLSSCGIFIINPPWQLDQKLQENLPHLLRYLNLTQGTFKLKSVP